MKKVIGGLVAAAGMACCAHAQAQVVISAVYGGGGSTSTTFLSEFNADFIELKNTGTVAQSINGWSLQYAASRGTNWSRLALPNVTIPPGGYFLVRTSTPATCGVGAPCRSFTQDFAGTALSLSGTAGKVALVNNNVTITAGTSCPSGSTIVDFVGYGQSDANVSINDQTNCFEGTLGATTDLGNQYVAVRQRAGCQDTNVNFADFAIQSGAFTPRNAASPAVACPGPATDCDANGTPDSVQIAGNPALDCNGNGQLDACDLGLVGSGQGNPQLDDDFNGVIDVCQIAANPSLDCDNDRILDFIEILNNAALDCNVNNQLDTCEINAAGGTGGAGGTLDCDSNTRLDTCDIASAPSLYDANGNNIVDGCEVPGPGQDCDNNGVIDTWQINVQLRKTDANANGRIDDPCDGAKATEVPVNATVLGTGVRTGVNGTRFFNIQGATNGTNASYGGLRFDLAAAVAGIPGTATVDKVYLRLVQGNSGFTNSGTTAGANDIEISYSPNDTVSFVEGAGSAQLGNFGTDHAGRQLVLAYDFVRGTNTPVFGAAIGSGTTEYYKLFDASASNTPGGISVRDEVANAIAGTPGQLTLVLNTIAGVGDGTSATYVGWNGSAGTGEEFAGPTLVIFLSTPSGPTCDGIDFNNDGIEQDPTDIEAFLSVYSGGPCVPPEQTCNDIDFNNDGIEQDPTDIEAFLSVYSGGPCL